MRLVTNMVSVLRRKRGMVGQFKSLPRFLRRRGEMGTHCKMCLVVRVLQFLRTMSLVLSPSSTQGFSLKPSDVEQLIREARELHPKVSVAINRTHDRPDS